jgi:type IV pilus assembly protein PilE
MVMATTIKKNHLDLNLENAVESTTSGYCTDKLRCFDDFLLHRMGDTISEKNHQNISIYQHMRHSRYDSNAFSRLKGFSLLELLIALVIIGILVSITYPSYLNYLYQSRRTDAMTTLSQTQMILERCYSQNFSYNAACTALPTFPLTSPQSFYTITLSNLGASTYTLTAVPRGAQATDTTCATMTVNQANVKTGTNTVCWNP